MKLFVRVQLPLWGLLLLLCSPDLVASQQLLRGFDAQDPSFVQAMPNPQPFGGQVPMEGLQARLGQQQVAALANTLPWAANAQQLLQVGPAPAAPPTYLVAGAPAAAALVAPAAAEPPAMSAVVQAESSEKKDCKCDKAAKVSGNLADTTCSVSKVTVHEDHAANAGISLAAVSAIWGSSTLSKEQREKVTLAKVS